MNDDMLKKIHDELQQANKFNRNVSKAYSVFMVVILAVAILSPFVLQRIRSQQPFQAAESQSWHQVHNLVDRQEFEKALEVSLSLVKKNPDYWYGYSYLGTLYLAIGDLKKSEENYSRAYALFPDAENEKALKAIRKRVAAKTGSSKAQ